MTVFTGKSVYDAAVCGLICILRKPKLSAERMHVDDISTELKRVEAARIVAAEQLQQLYELFLDKIGESNAQIFNIHMMMLEDEDYNGSIEGMIRSEQVNAEYAVARTSDVFAQMLEAMDNEYMRARSADVRDVSNRLLSILTDTPMDFPWVPENSVVCADDLTPSETAALERRNIAALVTAHGSAISHTAILAHSMNIPTVIGIGGVLMPLEVLILDGTGKTEFTGSLGDVMKESAKIAVSLTRSIAKKYNIDPEFWKTKDIHIHAPEGAVPKDGPSAGVTLTTALVSALSGTPVRRDVAMTGEITLRGKVLAIGGLKEKTMAAYRAGVKTVCIPKENEPDIDELDDVVKNSLKFVVAEDISTVLETALVIPNCNPKEKATLKRRTTAKAKAEKKLPALTAN